MAFKTTYINDINQMLLKKRESDDESFTLTIPEHKLKKNAAKFNFVLKEVYEIYKNKDVKMFHILLSINEFFDMEWLVKNILDRKNKTTVKQEMQQEYNVKLVTRKYTKPKTELCEDIDEKTDSQ